MRSLILVGLAALSHAAPSLVARNPLDGATIEPVQWEVPAFKDQPPVLLNGTVQEVRAQLLALNPAWDADFPEHAPAPPPAADASPAGRLERRLDWGGSNVICSLNLFGEPRPRGYNEARDYLRRHPGRPRMNPGPRSCGRVSCSYLTAVYMCNDRNYERWLENWGVAADAIDAIWPTCNPQMHDYQGGQIFSKEDYNFILRQDDC